jgi:mRNA interferase YafQ
MYALRKSGQFKRDTRLCVKRGYDMRLFNEVIGILMDTGALPESYLPHPLKGHLNNLMEAHIKSDWLIIWYISESPSPEFEGTVNFVRTGSHADLFQK